MSIFNNFILTEAKNSGEKEEFERILEGVWGFLCCGSLDSAKIENSSDLKWKKNNLKYF
jgi:hypothetical protein